MMNAGALHTFLLSPMVTKLMAKGRGVNRFCGDLDSPLGGALQGGRILAQGYQPNDVDRLILKACLSAGVRFYWSPSWIIMIDIDGIDDVLQELSGRIAVLGFDTFVLNGKTVRPRLDYISDYGSGIEVDAAIDAIANWPRGTGLWIEIVARPREQDDQSQVKDSET